MKSKDEIKKYAELKYGMTNMLMDSGVTEVELKNAKIGFISGYSKCQEDNINNKYTEQDLRRAIHMSAISSTDFIPDRCDEIIKLLNK